MRKLSKLLAVLLTVCLLCGVVVSIVASAEEEAELFNSGNALNFVTDYPSTSKAFDATSSGYKVGSKVVYDAANGYAKLVYAKNYDGNTTDEYPHPTDEELASGVWGADRPASLAGKAVTARGIGHSVAAMANGNQWLTHDKIKDNGIVASVIEFDFGVDSNRYSYTNGAGKKVYSLDLEALNALIDADASVTDKAAAKAEAAASEELAMYESTGGNGGYMRFEGANVILYPHKVDGVWYLYTSSTAAEDVNDMFKLSNEVGVFDRFSFVWSFTYNEDDSITCVCNFYLNGEFCAEMDTKTIISNPKLGELDDKGKVITNNNAANAAFRRWYHAGLASADMHYADTYSMVYDNIAANYYTAAELAEYGLRGGFTTDYILAGGTKYYFSVEGAKALTANLTDGGTVKTGMSLDTFAPATELKNFFIDLDNGATVTFTPEAALVYDAYLVDAANQVYLYVNNGSLRGTVEEELNLGSSLFYNNFDSTTKSDSTRHGNHNVTDGDITSGIYVDNTLGYVRICGSGGPKAYLAATGGAFWGKGYSASTAITMAESAYSVLDFDYGTDKYTFSYTADVTRTIEATGSKAGDTYPGSQEATDMGNITLYMTVDSVEEYLEYVNGTKSLNGTKVTNTVAYYASRYNGTQTDVITNAKIVEGSFKPAYITPYFIMNNGSGKKYQNFVTVTSSEEASYISIGDNKIALSGVAGVTDHITVVFDNGITAAGQIWATVYVNGQYLGQVKSNNNMFGGIGVYNLNPEQRVRADYSMMLDNIAFNQYATGYTTEGAYGVDDLIADVKAGKTYSVAKCTDVYYTSANAFPGAWATADGGVTVETIPGIVTGLIAGLENGDTLLIGDDITFSSLPADRSFIVKAFNAAAVVLAGNAEETHKLYMIGDLYYVVGTGAGAITREDLKKTSDRYNIYTDFTVSGTPSLNATDASKDVNSGAMMQSDGDHFVGMAQTTSKSLGYYRFYGTGGKSWTTGGAAGYWMLGYNNEWSQKIDANGDGVIDSNDKTTTQVNYHSDLNKTDYAVVDFDFGSDRYTFAYVADVTRVTKAAGTAINADWLAANSTADDPETEADETNEYVLTEETVTISKKDYTFYQKTENFSQQIIYITVESYEEYLEYVKNPTSLAKTYSVTTSKNAEKYFVEADTVTNVVTNEDGTLYVADACRPAYLEGTSIVAYYMYNNKTAARGDTVTKFDATIKEIDGVWYLTASNGNKVRLTNDVKATDHITIVYDNGTLAEGVSYVLYVNGEYLTHNTLAALSKNYKKDSYYGIRGIGLWVNGNDKDDDRYSYMMDNVAINWYRSNVVLDFDKNLIGVEAEQDHFTGTVSYDAYVSAGYGVDDLIADLKAGIINPIYKCSDVVYTGKYSAGNGYWATADNFKTVDYIPGVALSKLEEGGTLITNADLQNVIPAVNNFTFVGLEGATIGFDSAYIAKEISDGTYACSKVNAGTMANVDLYDGMNFNLYIPNTLANIKVDGKALTETYNKNGIDAMVYSWANAAESFATKTVFVSATYTEGGVEYELNFYVALDIVKYASILYGDECSTVVANLAKEIVDYKVAAAIYADKAVDEAKVAAFYALHEDCACGITAPECTETVDLAVSYKLNTLGMFTMVIATEEQPVVVVKNGNGEALDVKIAGEAGAWEVTGLTAAYVDNAMTITVGENTVTYSLANYIAACGDNADYAAAKTLATALLEFAIAAENFKETAK